MKFRFRLKNQVEQNGGFSKKPFLFVSNIWERIKSTIDNLKKSYVLMSKKERASSLVLVVIALILIGFKSYQSYVGKTVLAPDSGGVYAEAMVGEVKFLSPVTAQTDAEKSISRLMFRGLVKNIGGSTVVPDIAESYSVSDDGKTYTFKLRSNATFSDGQPLTANDVLYTIGLIQNPDLKSPMNKTWASVDAEVVDASTITFTLPNAYGPFIYNCDFGIVPSHLTSDDFAKKLIGSGPYQFVKSVKDAAKINEVDLIASGSYYGNKPNITNIKINIYATDTDAIKQFAAIPGANGIFAASQNDGQKLDYSSSRQLGLIFNVRKDSLKDVAVRQKILTGGRFDSNLNLTLTTLNLPTQQRKAEELKARFAAQNINLKINYESTATLQDKLLKHDYELLLYGFDFGFDRDPYIYWHTSQLNALNLAGFSDKKLDILMEDARMLPDPAGRNVKYDAIFDTLSKNYVVEFYSPVVYNFAVKSEVKGIEKITGTQPYSRFDQIEKWYINEKRVRKP